MSINHLTYSLLYLLMANCFFAQNNSGIICYGHKSQARVDTPGVTAFEINKGKHLFPVMHYSSVKTDSLEALRIFCEGEAEARSIADGNVTSIAALEKGYLVIVRHGRHLSVYTNLDTVYVTQGQQVSAGSLLGKVFPVNHRSVFGFQLWESTRRIPTEGWFMRRE